MILRSACDALKEKLMASEMRLAEVVRDLVFEFDREFSEVADASRSLIAAFFTEVRSLEDEYAGGGRRRRGSCSRRSRRLLTTPRPRTPR